jgi:Protein of unknown function (DUF3616)
MTELSKTALAVFLATGLSALANAQQVSTYGGSCDASAAVALGADHFVVGNDERNTLHIYRRGQAQAVGSLELSTFLGTRADEESDIEGAAAVGTRIYWITSHGRNSRGKAQQARHRFFATEVAVAGATPSLEPVGKPYVALLRDMESSEALKPYGLAAAARLAAEAEGGLNIEGLAATPDGGLLIGFRNPIPKGRALMVPLQNPGDVVKGARARFGAPIELDLGARGIRSIERVGSGYLIVAGPPADSGSFALYRWSGQAGKAATPVAGVDLKGLRPEALFAIPQSDRVQLLSDDGGVMVDGVACKKLPEGRQAFRGLIVTLPP